MKCNRPDTLIKKYYSLYSNGWGEINKKHQNNGAGLGGYGRSQRSHYRDAVSWRHASVDLSALTRPVLLHGLIQKNNFLGRRPKFMYQTLTPTSHVSKMQF